MLDEILENKQYTAPYGESGYRLVYENLRNSMSGVRRALEIRARDLLFSEGEPDTEKTKEELKLWLDRWLSFEYIEQAALSRKTGTLKAGTEQVKKDLRGFRARFAKNVSYEADDQGNDFNAVTYERVIASALDRGPLRIYCMVSEHDMLSRGQVMKESKRDTKKQTLSKAEADYLLKLTAAFLLENRLRQESVRLTDANVTNWSISPSMKKVRYLSASTKEEIVSRKQVSGSDSLSKICFSHEWIDGFSLLDITEEGSLERWKSDHRYWFCYIDQGSGKPLDIYQVR